MATTKGRPAPLEQLPVGLVDELERALRLKGSIPLKKLSPVPLARNAELELQEKLIVRGFERTAKAMRVPVDLQLKELLAREPSLPLAALPKRLAGSVAMAEAKFAAYAIAQTGGGRLVVSRGKERLESPAPSHLGQHDLTRLRLACDDLRKELAKVAPKSGQPPRVLDRGDLRKLLTPLFDLLQPATRGEATTAVGVEGNAASSHAVRTTLWKRLSVLAAVDPLVYIPRVVEELESEHPRSALLHELLAMGRDGIVELRPESGIATLAPDDALRCPAGPQETLLSYLRLLVTEEP